MNPGGHHKTSSRAKDPRGRMELLMSPTANHMPLKRGAVSEGLTIFRLFLVSPWCYSPLSEPLKKALFLLFYSFVARRLELETEHLTCMVEANPNVSISVLKWHPHV